MKYSVRNMTVPGTTEIKPYVINNETGTTYLYACRKCKDGFIEDWKYPDFEEWKSYSSSRRKEIKRDSKNMFDDKLRITDIIRAKEALEKANVPCISTISTPYHTTGLYQMLVGSDVKEEENNMYIDNKDTLEITQKKYLKNRLENIVEKKDGELQDAFNLYEDIPETAEELIERITAGKFTLRDKADYNPYNFGPLSRFIWRGKDEQKDQEGYDKAIEAMCEEQTKVKDQIMIADAATGLKAVQEFEAKQFH